MQAVTITACVAAEIAQPPLVRPTNVGRRPLGFWPDLDSQIFFIILAILLEKVAKTPAIAEATLHRLQ